MSDCYQKADTYGEAYIIKRLSSKYESYCTAQADCAIVKD